MKIKSIRAFAITNPKNMGKVDTLIAAEVVKFVKDGVSGSELESAKKTIVQNRKQMDAMLARHCRKVQKPFRWLQRMARVKTSAT